MTEPRRNLTIALWCSAALAGLLQACAGRFYIEPDGLNYLDIAYAYLRHDWHDAINTFWSPLYSWLLALAIGATHVRPYWESTLLHVVNFAAYLFALVCFAFFFDEVSALRRERFLGGGAIPAESAWLCLGYFIFMYSSLELVGVETDTPDMWVLALFILASGILVRMSRSEASWLTWAGFGATLAAGYLAKSVMFPLAFCFLFCSLFVRGNWRDLVPRVLVAAIVFLALAGPWALLLSHSRGRMTFGDAGRLNYAYFVDGLYALPHWHGEIPGAGTPVHGTRQLSASPPVDEFATPIAGTYPPWYDTPYWDDGVQPHFDLRGQIRALANGAAIYFRVLSAEKGLVVGLLVLVLFGGAAKWARELAGIWPVWLPAVAMLSAFCLLVVETRYVGAAIAVLWCVLFSAVPLQESETNGRLAASVAMAVVLVLAVPVGGGMAGDLRASLRSSTNTQWEAARELEAQGLEPGDRVAVLGHSDVADYWAHLAQVRIVADMPRDALQDFWESRPDERSRILRLFALTGAKFLVTGTPPPASEMQGWLPLGATGYYALPLSPLRLSPY